jgi:hypothetical protein
MIKLHMTAKDKAEVELRCGFMGESQGCVSKERLKAASQRYAARIDANLCADYIPLREQLQINKRLGWACW